MKEPINQHIFMQQPFSASALLIFIRNPELGKVKTRIAAKVGDEKALAIYKALLQHTRETALQVDVDRLLFYTNAVNTEDDWLATDFIKQVQKGDELGIRMHNAFLTGLENYEKVIIVGSDIASIQPEILEEAFAKLDDHPFVIGPAIDGGYYLLGMKSPSLSLFENIEWSTDHVFADTIKKMETLGQSYHLLPTLSDIDHIEDWERYGWDLEKRKMEKASKAIEMYQKMT